MPSITLRPRAGVVIRESIPTWTLQVAALLEAGPAAPNFDPACWCSDCHGVVIEHLAKAHRLIPPHVIELARLLHPPKED